MLLVDVQHQVVIGVIHDRLHVGPQGAPSHIAPAFEEGGDVGLFLGKLHHLRVETGDEEDIVHECQQFVGVPFDLLGKHRLVFHVMRTVEELSEPQHGIQRCSDLIAHIQEEGVLQLLGLLGFLRLLEQAHLCMLHLGLVATHAEILGHAPLFVGHGDEAEVHIHVSACLVVEDRSQHLGDRTGLTFIHP